MTDDQPVYQLRPFNAALAPVMVSWARDATELRQWCGRPDHPAHPQVMTVWHADPDVQPFQLDDAGGAPVAYGELWLDEAEGEVELARLIVAPGRRGQGVGRALVHALLGAAGATGMAEAILRVEPDNAAARRCYQAAGMHELPAAEAAQFNAGQPRTYVWMRVRLEVP